MTRVIGQVRRVARAMIRALVSVAIVRAGLRRLARARLLPPVIWRHLPASRIVEFEVAGQMLRCQLPDTDGVARELDWIGTSGHEAATIDVFAELASGPGAIVDVGANVGLYTVIAAASSADPVWAFEPVPRTFRILDENLARNGFGGAVRVAQRAVGRESAVTSFHVPWGDCPSSASLDETGYRVLEGELIEVEVVRLDDVVDETVPYGLVKIDVEGFEHAVIDGMENLIRRWSPAIILESNYDGPAEAVETLLRGHGYSFSQLGADGPKPVSTIRTDEDEQFRNFLCQPTKELARSL